MKLVTALILTAAAAAGGATAARAAGYDVEVCRDIEYIRRDGRPLRLDAYLPLDAPALVPGVLVIHGGGWRSGTRLQLALQAYRFARAGIAAFAIEYRLAPAYRWPAQIEDVRAALPG